MAEPHVVRALPKMIRAAHDPALKDALTAHCEETQGHITTLEEVFEMLSLRAKGEKCDAIDGILDEGESLLADFGGSAAGDAAIIFSAQAVEHYEITRYGSLQAFARALGHADAADRLGATLAQEKAADTLMSKRAKARVNAAAEGMVAA
jgi:ferritin-like metal-binding protein YciE